MSKLKDLKDQRSSLQESLDRINRKISDVEYEELTDIWNDKFKQARSKISGLIEDGEIPAYFGSDDVTSAYIDMAAKVCEDSFHYRMRAKYTLKALNAVVDILDGYDGTYEIPTFND